MIAMAKPNLEALARELDQDLRAIRQVLRQPLESEIARGALTGPQRSAVSVIVMSPGGVSLKDLSARLGLAHSTVSGIVDRLEARGMVARKVDEGDGRFSRIVATEVVMKWVRETFPSLEVHPLERALVGATAREREAVVAGVRTLRRLLEREKGDVR